MAGLPKENIYGHTKKLMFIQQQIAHHMREVGRPVSLLDFGCGNGSAVSQFLAANDVQYTGVDIHQPSLDFARRHFARPNARFLPAVPDDAVFDIIVYSDVLEHLADPVSVLRSHHGRLRDTGVVIGAIPNGYGPFENEKRLDNLLHLTANLQALIRTKRKLLGRRRSTAASAEPAALPYNFASGHLQFFTKKSLAVTLRDSGFTLEQFKHGAFLGAPLSEWLLLRGTKIIALNTRIAERLPWWSVSTWYFTARKRPTP